MRLQPLSHKPHYYGVWHCITQRCLGIVFPRVPENCPPRTVPRELSPENCSRVPILWTKILRFVLILHFVILSRFLVDFAIISAYTRLFSSWIVNPAENIFRISNIRRLISCGRSIYRFISCIISCIRRFIYRRCYRRIAGIWKLLPCRELSVSWPGYGNATKTCGFRSGATGGEDSTGKRKYIFGRNRGWSGRGWSRGGNNLDLCRR